MTEGVIKPALELGQEPQQLFFLNIVIWKNALNVRDNHFYVTMEPRWLDVVNEMMSHGCRV